MKAGSFIICGVIYLFTDVSCQLHMGTSNKNEKNMSTC